MVGAGRLNLFARDDRGLTPLALATLFGDHRVMRRVVDTVAADVLDVPGGPCPLLTDSLFLAVSRG